MVVIPDYRLSPQSPYPVFVQDSALAMKNAVLIPTGAYLRFNQAYVFDYGAEYPPPTASPSAASPELRPMAARATRRA